MRRVFWIAVLAQAIWGQTPEAIRRAVDRALPPIQKSAATFVEKRACFSCHHNALTILTLRMAKDRGLGVDSAVLAAVEKKTIASGGTLDDVLQARNVNDPTPNDSLLLMVAPPDQAMHARAVRLASWQREDGHWGTSDFRPPHSSSEFTATATAVRALTLHLAVPTDARIIRARRWLAETPPRSTEDASFRLMGLVWAAADQTQIGSAAKDLLALQKRDGGWPQLPSYDSDAYSTGEAVYALRLAGAESPKGVQFLLSSQQSDGTWHVHTRMISPAEVSPPYFETGFPYKKDQFLSYAGSCWAVMGLLAGPHETSSSGNLMVGSSPTADIATLPPFERLTIAASYYGNASEVARMLDAGAPANPPAGTRGHTTPLRLASMSGDLQAVKALLTHGADPNVSSPLSEAITFNHADVVQALIGAGADVDLVESTGVNLMHWATITNRPAVIPVLAKAGVPLNDLDEHGFTPLMYAATIDFGDTKVLDALLAAGADASIKNFDKRTPLEQAHRLHHTDLEAALRAKESAR